MMTFHRNARLLLTLSLACGGALMADSPVQAQAPHTRMYLPPGPEVGGGRVVGYEFGFIGHICPQRGLLVDRVLPGGIAARCRLEVGDSIVSMNGIGMRCERDYVRALSVSDGYFLLQVRDCHGRGVIPLHVFLQTVPRVPCSTSLPPAAPVQPTVLPAPSRSSRLRFGKRPSDYSSFRDFPGGGRIGFQVRLK